MPFPPALADPSHQPHVHRSEAPVAPLGAPEGHAVSGIPAEKAAKAEPSLPSLPNNEAVGHHTRVKEESGVPTPGSSFSGPSVPRAVPKAQLPTLPSLAYGHSPAVSPLSRPKKEGPAIPPVSSLPSYRGPLPDGEHPIVLQPPRPLLFSHAPNLSPKTHPFPMVPMGVPVPVAVPPGVRPVMVQHYPYVQHAPYTYHVPQGPMYPVPQYGLVMDAPDGHDKRRVIKRRTRTGCLTCRKRRIKCDERKPHCYNCERLKKLCLGYEPFAGRKGLASLALGKSDKERLSVYDLL